LGNFDWRGHNRKISQETLKVIEQGFYIKQGKRINLIGEHFDEAIVLSPKQLAEIEQNFSKQSVKTPPQILIVDNDTSSMVAEGYLVMNFANAKRPDYNISHDLPCYSDYMIISPNVCFFRDVEYDFIAEPVLTSVVTIPAPNCKGAAKNISQEELDEVMKSRLRKMFAAAVHYGYKNLVLGAWGCGAFGHDPYRVANYFYELLFEEGLRYCFEMIIFAIYDKGEKKNYKAFAETFWNVAAKLSEDHYYADRINNEFSATPYDFSQNVLPYINFNFASENFEDQNIGYAHGLLKNGMPFMAELFESDDVQNVAFYLPVIEKFMELAGEPFLMQSSKNAVPMSYQTDVQGFHALCTGMEKLYILEDMSILNAYVQFLIEYKLIKFGTEMLNGYGFVLKDRIATAMNWFV